MARIIGPTKDVETFKTTVMSTKINIEMEVKSLMVKP